MYSLLIVDDEPIIVQRLQASINWSSLGIDAVYTAHNGNEALKLVKTQAIDVIISDVCMPSLDGLSLLKTIRESKIDVQVIFISGYSEFAYVKEALDYGGSGYISKPIDEDELLAAVKKTLSAKERKQQITASISRLQESLPYAQERFWINAINGYYLYTETFSEEAAKLDLSYMTDRYLCVCIDIHTVDTLKTSRKALLTFTTVCDLTNFFRNDQISSFFFLPKSCEAVGFIFLDKASITERIKPHIQTIVTSIREFNGCSAEYGISKPYQGWDNISSAYREAKHAASDQYNRSCRAEPTYANISAPPNVDYTWLHLFCLHVANQDLDAVKSDIAKLGESIPAHSSETQLRSLGFELGNASFDEMLANRYLHDVAYSELSFVFLSKIQSITNKESFLRFLYDMASVLISDIQMDNVTHSKYIIQEILNFVDQHYTEQISSKTVADYFYFNPSYFSRLFRSNMNIKFTTYLTNYRLNKAEELMRSSNMRISDIAASVGFNDARYFYKIYKQLRGITPKQFRERNG